MNSASFFLGARDGLSLPTELCERLLQYQIQEDRELDAQIVSIFEDTSCTRLKRVSLKFCTLKEHEAEILLRHELRELELIRMKVFIYLHVLIFSCNHIPLHRLHQKLEEL